MYLSMCVLVLVALLVRSAHSFSWDIVVGENERLEFLYDGTLTHTEEIPSAHYISSVSYDPVQYRVFFTDFTDPGMSISSFDLLTGKIQSIGTRELYGYYARVVYDPITQVLFWKQHHSIYSFSLNPDSPDKELDGNLLVTLDHSCNDIAVDGCGGYIYWITDDEIGRIRVDGSENEVLIDSAAWLRVSLVIDQQTQKMYWTETIHAIGGFQLSIESANLNGKNRKTLYIVKNEAYANSLAISNNFIYWMNTQLRIWQLPKNTTQDDEKKLFAKSSSVCKYCQRIAVNYTIMEQLQGIKSCEAVGHYLIQNNSKPECTVPVCQNYCLHGDCSVTVEGQPKCSCKGGYSGDRCEVNACHAYCLNDGVCSLNDMDKPICKCTADYHGDRCGLPICMDYCLEGDCSVSADGQPQCSCESGYSGERCQVYACHDYCLNEGACSLNEKEQPVCQCAAGYNGERCEVYCKDVNAKEETKFSCEADNSEKKKASACHQYCLNSGVCSLNEKSEPVCQCTADYEGERCDVPAFLIKCFLYAYKNKLPVTPSKAVKSKCASTLV